MILFHPLNKKSNKLAIEKYKDRMVYIKSNSGWYIGTLNSTYSWGDLSKRIEITFKSALKLTKNFSEQAKIEYHFIDEFGNNKPNIKYFDIEDVHNCPTVKFNEIIHNQSRL